MVAFRDENIIVISPGSSTTLAQLRLAESLTPASIQVPTKVYKHVDHPDEDYFASSGLEENAIYPLVKGKITNLPALKYFLKLVYRSAMKQTDATIKPALLLVNHSSWTRPQVEEITKYVFEDIAAPALTTLSNGLVASFAYAAQDSLVIDVGKDKTDIIPTLDFSVVETAQVCIPYGGSYVNEKLSELLPNLTASQVEALKTSPIYEVLTEDEHKNSWFALNQASEPDAEDEGVIDVAAIVTSGRTREILEEREKQKNKEQSGSKVKDVPNMEREFNSFIDSDGKEIEVGNQRFHGTEELIEKIVQGVGQATRRVDLVNKRQDLWDNIIVVGLGSKIKGFRESLVTNLQDRYLLSRASSYPESSTLNSSFNSPAPNAAIHNASNQGHGQSPASIRLMKMADYFPEWKGVGWENASFLGAQIAAKQLFTGSLDSGVISRREYNAVGPVAIWEI